METTIDLSTGGTVAVFVGTNGHIPEFAHDPRIRFIDCKETPGELLVNLVPENTKAIILSQGLPEHHYAWGVSFCQRKGLPYLNRKTNQAIYETLKTFTGSKPVKATLTEVKETMQKGKLADLMPLINYAESNAENARRLLGIAVEKGIQTTFASLAQYVANERKKHNGGTVPKSARNKLDVSVEMLDNSIKELTDMREFLIAITKENSELKAKIAKIEAAFK